MPSPIAHSAMGYVIYKISQKSGKSKQQKKVQPFSVVLLATVLLSLLPDLDSIVGIVSDDFARFHNNGTHSLISGLVVALIAGLIGWSRATTNFKRWFLIVLISYEMHVIMDFFTPGRGVMLLWPFSSDRFISPFPVFYGFHWSEGLFSILHLWTFATEMAFAGVLLLGLRIWENTMLRWRRHHHSFAEEGR